MFFFRDKFSVFKRKFSVTHIFDGNEWYPAFNIMWRVMSTIGETIDNG